MKQWFYLVWIQDSAKVYKYLKTKKLTGKYSSFTIAGAAIGVTHKKFKNGILHFDNLKHSIKLT